MSPPPPPNHPAPDNAAGTIVPATGDAVPFDEEDAGDAMDLAAYMRQSGTVASPMEEAIARNMSPAHVGKIIENDRLSDANRHARSQGKRQTQAILFGCVLVFVLALAWLMLHYGKGELLQPVIYTIVGGAGGFGAGYSLGRNKPR